MKYVAEVSHAFANLYSHKLRTFLTMLGMIFGVGAVIAMLSIGAGAEKESLRLIDTMGLRDQIRPMQKERVNTKFNLLRGSGAQTGYPGRNYG